MSTHLEVNNKHSCLQPAQNCTHVTQEIMYCETIKWWCVYAGYPGRYALFEREQGFCGGGTFELFLFLWGEVRATSRGAQGLLLAMLRGFYVVLGKFDQGHNSCTISLALISF